MGVFVHGVAIGQSALVACLASTGDSPHCFWEWRFSPYAMLFDADALRAVVEHRSTLVLGSAALLFAAWWRGADPRRS
jgi:hypothetical protein